MVPKIFQSCQQTGTKSVQEQVLGGQRCTRFLEKFRSIALYWMAKGVDGFRYDMAEMVPYNLELHEFYNKIANKDAFFDEVYNPAEYRIIFD
jgi:glycosidase